MEGEEVCKDDASLGHICIIGKEEVSDETDVTGDRYKCGGCSQEVRSICQLHEHLLKEFLLGSYIYDHCTKTAYPRQSCVSAETQTDKHDYFDTDGRIDDISRDSESVNKDVVEKLGKSPKEYASRVKKARRKRKYDKRAEEAGLDLVSKKKAKSKNSEIYSIDSVRKAGNHIKVESTETLSGTAADSHSLKTKETLEYEVKDETLEDCYDESTDDNYETLGDIGKDLVKHSKEGRSVRKSKRKPKKKEKIFVTKSKKNKSKVKEKADIIPNVKIEETNLDTDDDCENTEILDPLNSAGELKKRGRPKTKGETFMCEICDCVFHMEKRLYVHLHRVHRSVYPFLCKLCNLKPFKSQEDYEDHMDVHPKQSFKCELCEKELKSREGLRLHELIHSGEKPFCCDQCDYKGRTSTQLRQHTYTHMDSKTEQCEHCGKAFFTKGKLKEHLRYCRKEFNHHCPYCQKGFPTASGLRKHILMHTGERAFICDVCGFATFRITLLNSHMRTHTGEKPHKCKECGAKLATRGTLLLHLRTHTHEKPFVCSYCSKAFTSKWNLQTHLRQHTGETPYKCDICGQGFKQNVLRKSHMRSHLELSSTEQSSGSHLDQSTDHHATMEIDTSEHSLHSNLETAESLEPAHLSDRRLEPGKLQIINMEPANSHDRLEPGLLHMNNARPISSHDRRQEPARLQLNHMEPDRSHLNNFVYDRSNNADILNQALHSEELHPLDLKLHFTSASEMKNVYNNSVINSNHQLQSTSFEMINYQDIKHV